MRGVLFESHDFVWQVENLAIWRFAKYLAKNPNFLLIFSLGLNKSPTFSLAPCFSCQRALASFHLQFFCLEIILFESFFDDCNTKVFVQSLRTTPVSQSAVRSLQHHHEEIFSFCRRSFFYSHSNVQTTLSNP
jgi:hypothetical protein